MKRLILTGYDDAMAMAGNRTTPGKAAYAERWQVHFECVRAFEPGSHPSWQKLRLLRERLEVYHEILWLDADTVVTNGGMDIFAYLQPLMGALVASEDWGPCRYARMLTHFSLGNFLVRRTARPLLAKAEAKTAWQNQPLWEQAAVQEVAREGERYFLDIVPRRVLNAVPAELRPAIDPWQAGDFLAHLTAESHGPRLEWLEKHGM